MRKIQRTANKQRYTNFISIGRKRRTENWNLKEAVYRVELSFCLGLSHEMKKKRAGK